MPLFRLPSRAKARSAAERGNSGRLAVPRCLTMPTCWLAYRSAWRAPFRGASAPAPLADSLHQPAALCRAGFQPARSLRVAALSIRLAVPTRGASCLTCGAGAFRPVRFLSTCRRPGAREGAAARPVERAACRTGASRRRAACRTGASEGSVPDCRPGVRGVLEPRSTGSRSAFFPRKWHWNAVFVHPGDHYRNWVPLAKPVNWENFEAKLREAFPRRILARKSNSGAAFAPALPRPGRDGPLVFARAPAGAASL